MDNEKLNKLNRSKYGEKKSDLISIMYSRGIAFGNVWCFGNVERYLTRFNSENSEKNNNKVDLLKCLDYIERSIEANGFDITVVDIKNVKKKDFFKEINENIEKIYISGDKDNLFKVYSIVKKLTNNRNLNAKEIIE